MRALTRTLTGWFVVLALVSGGLAQTKFDPYEWNPDPGDPRSYESTRQRFSALLDVWDYPSVFRALRLDAEASPAWEGTEPAYRSLLQALEILDRRLAAFRGSLAPAPGEATALDGFLDDVPTGLFQCTNETCFGGQPFEVTFEQLAELSEAQGEDFRYRVDAVDHLLWDLKEPTLKTNVMAIRAARERWDAFVDQGMSQYPWEAGLNNYLAPEGTIEFPPARQWILLHPELGVEVSTDGIKDLRVKESLLVEAVGHVWYRWRKAGDPGAGLRWWGVSAAASLRDDLRPGIGLVGHYGKLYTLGVLWHDGDEDGAWFDQAPFVVLGLDLFRLVADRAPEYQRKWQQALEARDRLLPSR